MSICSSGDWVDIKTNGDWLTIDGGFDGGVDGWLMAVSWMTWQQRALIGGEIGWD